MYKFEPLLKQTIWGGDKIIPFKHLDTKLETVGESWEISGVKDNETIVANGEYKGKSLNELVRELKAKLVRRTSSDLAKNSLYLSSLSMPVRTSAYRFTLMMKLPIVMARSVARPRCGTV